MNQLKACAELGVDYADTSGESTFMRILEDVEVDKCFGRNENDTFLVKVIFVDMKLVTCEAFLLNIFCAIKLVVILCVLVIFLSPCPFPLQNEGGTCGVSNLVNAQRATLFVIFFTKDGESKEPEHVFFFVFTIFLCAVAV